MPSSTFGAADFKVFDVKGFQARMQEIRGRIRPKLETLGGRLAPELQRTTGESTFAHVARHARRTVNPPDDTWDVRERGLSSRALELGREIGRAHVLTPVTIRSRMP